MLVELRHSPDPRVLIEVALVQLCRQRVSTDELEALAGRVAKLERAAAAARGDAVTGRPGHRAGQARRARPATGESRQPPEPPAPAGRQRTAAGRAASRATSSGASRRDRSARPVERHGSAKPARPHPGAVRARRDRRRRWRCRHPVGAQRHPPGEVRATGRRRRTGAGRGRRPPDQGALGVGDRRRHHAGRQRSRRANAVDERPRRPDDSQPVLSGGPSVLERLSEAFPGATLVGEDD